MQIRLADPRVFPTDEILGSKYRRTVRGDFAIITMLDSRVSGVFIGQKSSD